jgi:hypothetical protein
MDLLPWKAPPGQFRRFNLSNPKGRTNLSNPRGALHCWSAFSGPVEVDILVNSF